MSTLLDRATKARLRDAIVSLKRVVSETERDAAKREEWAKRRNKLNDKIQEQNLEYLNSRYPDSSTWNDHQHELNELPLAQEQAALDELLFAPRREVTQLRETILAELVKPGVFSTEIRYAASRMRGLNVPGYPFEGVNEVIQMVEAFLGSSKRRGQKATSTTDAQENSEETTADRQVEMLDSVKTKTAAEYLDRTTRQILNLRKKGALRTVGEGLHLKITTESLRLYKGKLLGSREIRKPSELNGSDRKQSEVGAAKNRSTES